MDGDFIDGRLGVVEEPRHPRVPAHPLVARYLVVDGGANYRVRELQRLALADHALRGERVGRRDRCVVIQAGDRGGVAK